MSTNHAKLRNLARQMNAPKLADNNSLPPGSFIKGTVTAVQLGAGTISCTIMGDTTELTGICFLDTYTPIVGDSPLFLKQGTDLIAIGTVQSMSGTASWTSVPGASGFGPGVGGPPEYRAVIDNGDIKVQVKGSLSCPGSGTGLAWTWPAGSVYVPSFQRDFLVSTNVTAPVSLYFLTNGQVFLSNSTPTQIVMDGLEYFVD